MSELFSEEYLIY